MLGFLFIGACRVNGLQSNRDDGGERGHKRTKHTKATSHHRASNGSKSIFGARLGKSHSQQAADAVVDCREASKKDEYERGETQPETAPRQAISGRLFLLAQPKYIRTFYAADLLALRQSVGDQNRATFLACRHEFYIYRYLRINLVPQIKSARPREGRMIE